MHAAKLKIPLVLALIAALPLGLAPPGEAWQDAPTAVRVVVLPFLSFAPLFIAQEEGHFAEQGLAVTFESLAGSTEALPVLAQGGVDVVGAAVSAGLFNAIAGGAHLRVVADKGILDEDGCTNSALLLGRPLAGRVASPADLRGRRVALEATNLEGYYVDLLLRTAGLSLADIDVRAVPNPVLGEALQNGSIELAHASEPWITRIQRSGAGTVWVPAQDVVPNLQFAVLLFGPNLLERDPGAGQRFMAAYLKAVRQFLQGKTDRNLDILERATNLERGLLEEACWIPFDPHGAINAPSMADYQAWALERGLIDEIVPAERFWDPRFVEFANAALADE